MSNKLNYLYDRKLISPPSWLCNNTHYLVMMGSVSYGCESDNSDIDVYGFCIPPKSIILPHTAGYIYGYDNFPKFDQYQQHHILDKDALGGKGQTYDITVYSIIRLFRLLSDNNPNIIDSLFVPQDCVLFSTQIGQLVRENRKIFLHKGCWQKFKGYAYSQVSQLTSRTYEKGSKRALDVEEHGFSTKFGYHTLRLLNECQQILEKGDLDLRENREQLKACRRGEISAEEIRRIFSEQERALEKLYTESKLQHKPDEDKIKELLLNCLEQHYGSLSAAVVRPDNTVSALREIQKIAQNVLDKS
jgi:uncharacterized protein